LWRPSIRPSSELARPVILTVHRTLGWEAEVVDIALKSVRMGRCANEYES